MKEDPTQPAPEPEGGPGPFVLGPEEVVEGVPVVAEVREVAPPQSPAASPSPNLPAVHAAAAAATGFVAGAATLALLHRRSSRRLARRVTPRRAIDALPVVGSRTFIVDVHLLGSRPGS